MTQPTPADRDHQQPLNRQALHPRHTHWNSAETPAIRLPGPTRLDCDGCPVASGEVPDADCAECVVSVFLAAEPWPDDS